MAGETSGPVPGAPADRPAARWAGRSSLRLPDGGVLPFRQVPFQAASFDPRHFARHAIPLPDAIARSVRKRQAEFLHGRLAARAALQDLGVDACEVPIGPSREPVWPAGVVGSISHTDGIAVAAAARASNWQALGMDIERTALGAAQQSLREIALDPSELSILASLAECAAPPAMPGAHAPPLCTQTAAGWSLDALVTTAFSAKESFFKGAYGLVRRFIGFDAARLVAVDTAQGVLTLELTEHLHPCLPSGRRCAVAFRLMAPALMVTAFVLPRRGRATARSGPP